MNTPNPTASDGGAIAIRGFRIQTLIALLEVSQSDFTELTLEPDEGNQKFDYRWLDGQGIKHAVQVKSTQNSFGKSDVERWAKDLQAQAGGDTECKLVLVGNRHPKVQSMDKVERVLLDFNELKIDTLEDAAAHRIAAFLEREQQPTLPPQQCKRAVDHISYQLLSHPARALSRQRFLAMLLEWVAHTPNVQLQVNFEHFDFSQYAPQTLLGREEETLHLHAAWQAVIQNSRPRHALLTVVALGGEGKTSLVADWLNQLSSHGWPGASAVFAWSFYSQGTREQASASSDLFLQTALRYFGDPDCANSNLPATEKARQLAQKVGAQKALLILDGLEPLQYPPATPDAGKLRDNAMRTLLRDLARYNDGLCVVTSRYAIADLKDLPYSAIDLPRLPTPAGVQLLTSLEVVGTDAELQQLVEEVQGHALTLCLLGSYLRDAFAGDIHQRQQISLQEADAEMQGGHAFRVMDAYVAWLSSGGDDPAQQKKSRQALALWQLLGLFDRPAPANCLAELFKAPKISGLSDELQGLKEHQLNLLWKRLQDARLLTVQYNAQRTLHSVDTHPLIREYFAEKLRTEKPGAWQNAHRRIYKLLCQTKEGEQPTLEQLQPLLQAVAHGCAAGLHEEAFNKIYWQRIQKCNKNYLSHRLGAFADDLVTLANFFAQQKFSSAGSLKKEVEATLLAQTGYCLRVTGRIREALTPMQMALEMATLNEDWVNAGRAIINISESHLELGDIQTAIHFSQQGIEYANLSGDGITQAFALCTLANALHQLGDTQSALSAFQEAESIELKAYPKHLHMYSRRGFLYCDLLITQGNTLEARERAIYSLDISTNKLGPLSVGLSQLTLGCSFLEKTFHHQQHEASTFKDYLLQGEYWLNKSVANLRTLEQMTIFFSLALLARAALYRAISQFTLAHQDLQEVKEIAEPSGMRLHLTDYHLEYARLALAENLPEEARQHVAAAEQLIQATGYHRRDGELAELHAALATRHRN